MKVLLLLLGAGVFFVFSYTPSYASSTYVLPYPSVMPGGISYKIHVLFESVAKYWYFGDFGHFTYNLKESDKYLVQAKTLFEYQQYLLGFQALKKSDAYFINTSPNLIAAKKHGKNISQDRALLESAAEKHREVLTALKQEVPSSVTWTPEKNAATHLSLRNALDQSIAIRKNSL